MQYELASIQRNQENAKTFESFVDSLNDDKVEGNGVRMLSLKQRTDFLAFFLREAVNRFVKNCKYVLTTATNGQDDEAVKLARLVVEI